MGFLLRFAYTPVSLGVALLLATAGWAQTPAAPAPQQGGCTQIDASGKQVFVPNCGVTPGAAAPAPTEKSKSAAQSFPFPGENPGQPAEVTTAPQPSGTPASPSAPSGAAGLKDAGSSGSSSSSDTDSSSSSSSRGPGMGGLDPLPNGPLPGEDDDPAAKAAAARHAHKKAAPAFKQTPDQREAEDIQIASYYQNDGNFRGAYLRATDAVSITDTDPDAHFALAEAARRLGKLDEAEKQYKRCLELDPVDKEKKAAQRALKQMSGN